MRSALRAVARSTLFVLIVLFEIITGIAALLIVLIAGGTL